MLDKLDTMYDSKPMVSKFSKIPEVVSAWNKKIREDKDDHSDSSTSLFEK